MKVIVAGSVTRGIELPDSRSRGLLVSARFSESTPTCRTKSSKSSEGGDDERCLLRDENGVSNKEQWVL